MSLEKSLSYDIHVLKADKAALETKVKGLEENLRKANNWLLNQDRYDTRVLKADKAALEMKVKGLEENLRKANNEVEKLRKNRTKWWKGRGRVSVDSMKMGSVLAQVQESVERDSAIFENIELKKMLLNKSCEIGNLKKERDELKAEVKGLKENLRKANDEVVKMGSSIYENMTLRLNLSDKSREIGNLKKERDELKAEVMSCDVKKATDPSPLEKLDKAEWKEERRSGMVKEGARVCGVCGGVIVNGIHINAGSLGPGGLEYKNADDTLKLRGMSDIDGEDARVCEVCNGIITKGVHLTGGCDRPESKLKLEGGHLYWEFDESGGDKPDLGETVANYSKLHDVYRRAGLQASVGKGKDRHAGAEPYDEQPIMWIEKHFSSFQLGQAVKKIHESQKLPKEQAEEELLGAINYIAAHIIHLSARPDSKKNRLTSIHHV